ncbi:hypothetical protein NDU88_002563 [Pleurodeles waltl]|uniref:Uncharacterized protein n=1 Tax=Pleurodeles waltl TaxID=8319 RepID=A0AAV7NHH4_PLEWA|nr:hypothetical protein NDU88_002563 [Pleurodeles waltl]
MLAILLHSEIRCPPNDGSSECAVLGLEVITQQDITEVFATHFQKVYTVPVDSLLLVKDAYLLDLHLASHSGTDGGRLDAPITEEEIEVAIQALKTTKTLGGDGLLTELYQHRAGTFMDRILEVFNEAY